MKLDIEIHTVDRVVELACGEWNGYEVVYEIEDGNAVITELRVLRDGELLYQAKCPRVVISGNTMKVNVSELVALYENPERMKWG